MSTAFGATTRALSLPDWLGQVALSLQSSRSLSYPKTPCIGCNSLEVSGEELGILGSDGLGVDGSEADSTLSTFVQLPLTDPSMDNFTSSYTMISHLTVGYCMLTQARFTSWLLTYIIIAVNFIYLVTSVSVCSSGEHGGGSDIAYDIA